SGSLALLMASTTSLGETSRLNCACSENWPGEVELYWNVPLPCEPTKVNPEPETFVISKNPLAAVLPRMPPTLTRSWSDGPYVLDVVTGPPPPLLAQLTGPDAPPPDQVALPV